MLRLGLPLRYQPILLAELVLVFLPALPPGSGIAAEPGLAGLFPDVAIRIYKPAEISSDFIALSPGDFDGDGRTDLAGPTRYSGLALVQRSGTDWTWRGWPTVDLDQDYASSSAADFDGDGLTDLAYAEAGQTFVWFGSKTNGFEEGPQISGTFAAGDFDGDGFADLALIDDRPGPDEKGERVLQVFRGRRDRTFAEADPLRLGAVAGWPAGMAAWDLDGDGALDLTALMAPVWLGPIHLYTFDGKGDGTFELRLDAPLEGELYSHALGDVDGDGKVDLVIPFPHENLLRAFLGRGDGTFDPGPSAPAFQPEWIACADLDGDGRDEILAAESDSTLAVFRMDGAGWLGRIGSYLGGGRLARPIADLDGDGRLDVALFDEKGIILLRGVGDGTLVAPRTPPAYSPDFLTVETSLQSIFPQRRGVLAAEDVDGDKIPDLLWLRGGAGPTVELAMAFGKGDGTFRIPAAYRIGDGHIYHPSRFTLADLDGDGAKDVLFADFGDQFPEKPGSLIVFLGKGDGTFRAGARSYPAGQHPIGLAAGRIDDDTFPDVAVDAWEGTLTIFRGKGDGTLEPWTSFQVSQGFCQPTIGDLDGDGLPDIAFTSPDRPSLRVLLGDGRGGFEDRSFDFSSTGCWLVGTVVTVDTGNRVPSLLIPESEGYSLFSLEGRELRWIERLLERTPLTLEAPAFADLDGAGRPELLVAGWEELEVFVPGEKAAAVVSPTRDGARDLAVVDLDGDGRLEVVTLGTNIVVHRRAPSGGRFLRGDANGDGPVDISDPILLLGHLFLGGRAPGCLDAADVDDSGILDITDAVYSLSYSFLGGPSPPAPFPGCGPDPTVDGLDCSKDTPCK